MQVKRSYENGGGQDFKDPRPFDCAKYGQEVAEFERDVSKPLNVVCVKYGTKYGADYVNKLYYGVKKHLSLPHTFTCFTEDP